MRTWFASLPIWIIIADLWFSVIVNITQSLDKHPAHNSSAGNLPIVPEFAFNWLQVAVNGAMAIVLSLTLLLLIRLYRQVQNKQTIHWNGLSVMSILLSLIFSLPACYGLIMQMWHLFGSGQLGISFANLRYLVIALLLPYPAFIAILIICHGIKNKLMKTETN